MSKRDPIPASFWWRIVTNQAEVMSEFIAKAKRAEAEQVGHECGHRFTISITSATHSGISGEGPESHRDAPYFEDEVPLTVEVRASSLHDALLVASTIPFSDWVRALEESEGVARDGS